MAPTLNLTAEQISASARSLPAWREGRRQLAVQARTAECDARRELQGLGQRAWSQGLAAELRSSWAEQQGCRECWEEDLWSGPSQLRQRVAVLGANMRFADNAEDLRKMVSTVEHKLQVYAEKSRQQHEELVAEEYGLEQSLQASLVRFEAWTHSSAPPRAASAPRLRQKSAERPPEGAALRQRLKEVSERLAPGRGAWSPEDHDAFARLLLGRFRGRATPAFLDEAQLLLPGKSHEALVAHGTRLLEQEALQAERRELLGAWREQQAREVEQAPREPAEEAKQERRARSEVQRQARRSCAEQKKRVEAWRSAQEARRAEAAEREADERRREADAQRARQQQRQAQKEELLAFRRQKQAEKEMERQAAAPAEARRLSPRERQRISARNEALLRQREQRRQEACERRLSYEPPVRAAGASYPQVESRLWSHTEEFVDRARSLQETQELERKAAASKYSAAPGNFAHQGLVRTLRSVPSWRLGVAGA